MKIGITLIACLLIARAGFASGEWTPAGGRSAAIGMSSVALSDCWSVNNNQAGMAFFDRTAAGVYFENRFLVKEMGLQTGAFSLKTKHGMLGATIGYSGDANYNNTTAGLAYAMKLGNRFAAGIQLDYIGTALGEEYGKRSNLTFEAGIMAKMTEQLTFGAHVFNPLHVKISEFNDERIPTILNAGFGYEFSNKLLLTAEAFKNSEFPMELRTGAEYKFNKMAFARIGLGTNPFRYTFGFGIETKIFSFDLSSSVHQQLGYSPQASLQYNF